MASTDELYDRSPGQTPAYARGNARRRKDDRNRRVMEMWKAGMTTIQIAKALADSGETPIQRARVDAIIKRGLQEARASRMEIAEEAFDGELDRLTGILRNAWAIVTATCRSCSGSGSDMLGVCEACQGDGKQYRGDTRIRALKESRAAIDQRAKMLGYYAPEKFAFTDTEGNPVRALIADQLSSMSGDELDRALADYAAGMEAAGKLEELTRARSKKSAG